MFSRPLLYITVFFAAGTALPGMLALSPLLLLLFALVATVVTAIFFAMRKNVLFILPALFFLLGAASAGPDQANNRQAEIFLGKTVTLEGYVCRDPDFRGDRVIYTLEINSVMEDNRSFETGGRVLLYLPGGSPEMGYGDVLRVKGRVFMPETPGNPGQFDYGEYLYDRGIWGIVALKDWGGVEKIGTGGGNPVAGIALGIKQKLMEINRSTLSPEHAALVNGIVFGSRGEIDQRTGEIFSETGVVHILSVSGLHVGLVAAGVLASLSLLGMQRAGFPVLTVVLVIYTFITGMGPAVVRSSIMAWIQIMGHQLGRERDWVTTLSASALIILVFSPRSLFDPGFQLSYAATWGILHLGRMVDSWLASRGLKRPWVRGTISVSLGAQIGTLPLVAYYFNIVSLISIAANLLVVPLVGIILPLGFLAPLAGLVFLKASLVINYATAALLDLMMLLVGLIHSIPGGVMYVASPPLAAMAVWYMALLALPFLWKMAIKRSFFFRLLAVCLLSVSLLLPLGALGVNGGMQVHVIDVGQGDSILVRLTNGRTILVDAGGWKDEFEKGRGAGEVVAGYLRRIGITRLDVLVLTHPHEDHAAGAGFLLGRFDIGTVLISQGEPGEPFFERPDPAYESLMARFKNQGIAVREVSSGDTVVLDPRVQVEVLGPGTALLNGTRSDLNNNSVVLSVKFGRNSFLLTGDIELEGQVALMERGFRLKHDVLKVPHHGSRYLSAEFISRVSPGMSVISVGSNSFGQPSGYAIALAGARGRPVYRTDRDGLVLFLCDGNRITVKTGRNEKLEGVYH